MQLYQLVLKGSYSSFSNPAEFRDTNVFKTKEEITDEYVKSIKEKLLDIENIFNWQENERNPIEEYIQKLTLVERKFVNGELV